MNIDFNAVSFWIGVTSLAAGVFGVGLTIFFYISRMNKTMEKLLERQKGILTLEQAKKITEFHLRDIKIVLERNLAEFCNRVIVSNSTTQNFDVARRELLNLAEASIIPSRNSISVFLLRGEVRMDNFMEKVNPLNGGIIQVAVENMLTEIESTFSKFQQTDDSEEMKHEIKSKISLMADETIREAKARIYKEMEEVYSH